MEYVFAVAAVCSALASVLAWVAKIRWSKEFADAKNETIKAKEAQLVVLRERVDQLQELTPMRIREYFLSVSQQLEEFNNMLQTQLETAHAEISTKAAEISQLREQGRAQTAEAKQLAEQKLRLEKKTQALEGQVEHFRPKATAIVDTFPGVDIRPLQEIISSSSSLSDALTDALDFGFLTQMYARFWNDLADHASA